MRETPSFNSRSFEYGRSPEGSAAGAAMLPTFLNDLRRSTAGNGGAGETVELTLDIEDDSFVLSAAAPAPVLSRSSSAASKLRRIFSWRRSTSERENINHQSTVESVREKMKLKTKMMRNQSSARRALGGLRFISKTTVGESSDPEVLWKKVEARFDALAKDGMLSRIDFGECIGMGDSKEFAVGVFDALVRRRRRRAVAGITKAELREFWLQISDQSFDARLQIFFDMADSNGDGKIARDEVQELIMLSASANKLSNLKERAKEYASLIMEELDPECLGYIELWQLETLLLQRDNYMNYSRPLSTTTSAGWSQNISSVTAKHMVNKIGSKLKCLVSENWQRGWILLLWLSIMAGLFTWKYQQYRRKAAFHIMGHCITTAKGAAETLKFNMALILLPVCRNMLTWLRSSRARLIIPFDDNINFHKVVAYAIGIGVVIHAGVHLTCDFPRLVRSSPDKFALIASDFHGEKPTYSRLLETYIGVTGILMVALMMIVFTLATSKFRKNGGKLPPPFNRLTGFNAFWYSHHLTAIIYILFLIHGTTLFLVHQWYQKTTWMYISIPLLLYVADRTLRTHRPKDCAVKILKVNVLPGGVFSLILAKPNGFKYKSGQYIFLQCPTISPFEWHPFSLTSAPGDDYLSVHIRAIGDWTQELKRVFTEDNCSASVIGHAKFGTLEGVNHTGVPKLLVDGPYGAPAQEYQNYDVLLLVGLGIGATPFISILKDLLNNTKLDDHSDSNTDATTSDDSLNSMTSPSDASSAKKRVQRARTAHFYWITRESGSFEWFKGVMNEVAEMDLKGQIELHNYLTSVYEESDARSTLITMVQALNHAKHGVDILSGTRVRTHFARPNWRHVFNKVASKHPCSTVGVFYCGMPVLAKELKQLSQELTQKTSTRFEFHKEYF